MKKTLIALAVLATSGAAMAQSTFTLYGVADVNVERLKGADSVMQMSSGGLNGSRWGLRGSEDLSGGLKAVFNIESGYNIDTGRSVQGGRLFGRQAFAGLEGGFGSVRLGRQYTPIGNVADIYGTKGYDVLALLPTLSAGGLPSSMETLLGGVGVTVNNSAYRADNAITYKTPAMGGFSAEIQYSFQAAGDETNSGVNKKLGRQFGLNGVYANGPITAAIGYVSIQDTFGGAIAAGDQKANEVVLVGGYDLGVAKVMGVFTQTDYDADENMTVFGLSAAFPFGAATVTPGFAIAQDATFGLTDKADVKFFTLQATYDLSKRTALYSNLTLVDNDEGTNFGFNGPEANKGSNGIQFGVRHRF